MNKKAIISVTSKIKGEEQDKIEVVTPGKFYQKGDSFYAVYDETEISGMEGTTTTLKISSEKVSLIRMGTTSTKMNFKDKLKDVILYNTPYGMLQLELETNKLDIDMNEDGGHILVDYNLGTLGDAIQNTLLEIKINTQ
ncbi:DUF1934 domain-containing protein [Haloimpatiens massiliensis]|uniref:DUF1934 domain-containing protein n=1 Tax=Haloimpatiens massiliensis TaxID=1658110 RepID=UPI000C817881|nr:DUF1934 domain-containing protein [Haloimpatiens massiliensis]